YEGRERERIVGAAVLKAVGQRAAHRIAVAVGELRLQNPRGARSDEYPDAPASPAAHALRDRLGESVLSEAQQGETVVAASKLPQAVRQSHGVHAGYLADVRIEIEGLERAPGESGVLLLQLGQHLEPAAANAAGRRERREHERGHVGLAALTASPAPRAT